MSDLVEFLRARLDEDEAVARGVAAPGRPMEASRYLSWFVSGRGVGDGSGNVITYGIEHDEAREHIARHDPARVLREVEAKRAVLALHTYEWMGPDDAASKGCEHDYEAWPCPTLHALAAVYADHPDYRQEWA